MGLNLHSIVRPAINSVNPDVLGVWRRSTGQTTAADGKRTPTFATVPAVRLQVQAASGDDLQHIDYMTQQGVYRKVYAFGDVEGQVRPDLKGGDILQFAYGGSTRDWLVVHVLETWAPDTVGWCSVLVALQAVTLP